MTFFRPLILVFLFSFFNNIGFSQEPTRCGTDEILEQQLLDPVFERSFNTVMDVLSSQSQRASSNETLTIPVVVHVFHDGDDYGTGTNIADEVIYDAIANLNAAFAGEPWHTSQYSGDFTHPYTDSNIEFCLASIDPDGNPTNGITRQNPDTLGNYTTQGMITTTLLSPNSEQNLKNLCYWPVQDYCNVYVVHKLNGGLSPLGFAYLPPVSGDYDGIVCATPVFGFEEPWLLSNFNKNGTLIHEMGHYLGLLHTFNFTNSCGTETNCTSQGDRLCDTPPTTGSAGCYYLNCPETMVENFMDYSNDYCMDRFSPDGVNRMRNQLITYRPGLISEDNLACGIPSGLDVKVGNIIVSDAGCNTIMSGVNYELRNLASDTLTEVILDYYVNDQTTTILWTGSLGFGDSEIITMPDFNVGFGPVTITIEATITNDLNTENNITNLEYVNYEGVYVDIIVEWDALPYGVDIELFEADTNNNPIGEPIFLYENEDNNLSCTVDTFSFCLSEGNYIVEVNDLFGNGFKYPCQFVDRCIWVEVNGEMVGDPLCGEWNNGDIIPFTVNLPCVLGDCPWDIDGDGIVAVSDIIIILQNFGLFYECSPMDFDQDGVIGVNDLLDVISVFGLTCSTGMVLDVEIPNSIIDRLNTLGVSPIYKDEAISKIVYYNIYGAVIDYNDMIPSGIYIRQIEFESGRVEVKKIIR
jgi:hypothetical protein